MQPLQKEVVPLSLPLTAAVTTSLARTPLPTCHKLHLLQSLLPHLAMLYTSIHCNKETNRQTKLKVWQLQEGYCVEPPKETIGWIPKTMAPDHRPMRYPSMYPDPRRLRPVLLVSAEAEQCCSRRSLLAAEAAAAAPGTDLIACYGRAQLPGASSCPQLEDSPTAGKSGIMPANISLLPLLIHPCGNTRAKSSAGTTALPLNSLHHHHHPTTTTPTTTCCNVQHKASTSPGPLIPTTAAWLNSQTKLTTACFPLLWYY